MGTDAAIWATKYGERFPDQTPDEGTLISWFANAIEAGGTAQNKPDDRGKEVSGPYIEGHLQGWIDGYATAIRAIVKPEAQ